MGLDKNNSYLSGDASARLAMVQDFSDLLPSGLLLISEFGQLIWSNDFAKKLMDFPTPSSGSIKSENLEDGDSIYNVLGYFEEVDWLDKINRAKHAPQGVKFTLKGRMDRTRWSVVLKPYEGYFLAIINDITPIYRSQKVRQDFVANVSHELRTPLTVIRGYLEMLAEDDALELTQDAGSWSKIFMQMYQQSMRMEKIIADLLWLSGLESDSNLEESQEKIYVKQLIQEIVSEAKSLSGMRNHDFDIDVDDSLTMKGERKLLYSAFSNLIFNAVNYTPPNGKIKIDTYITERHFVLTISDTGIGIDKKHIPRLTERFYRVDKARSRDEGGTGLGLAIVKHVLLRYRANLEIESEPGKGSSFHCMFQKSILEDC